jgi:putative ABC transport system permease protein
LPGAADPHLESGHSRSAIRRLGVLAFFPAIAGAVVASAVILTLSTAGGPLFQSSAGTAVIRSGIQDQGGLALSVKTRGTLAQDIVDYQERELTRATTPIASLGPVTTTLIGPKANLRTDDPSTKPASVTLLYRTGYLAHIDVLTSASGDGSGVWIPDVTAKVLHLTAGDLLTIANGPLTTTVRIAGIYRALVGVVPPYWAPIASAIYPPDPDSQPPPPPLFADREEFLHITTVLEQFGDYEWSYDLTPQARTGLNLQTATALTKRLRSIDTRSHDLTDPLGVALQQPAVSSPLTGLVGRAAIAENSIAGPVGTLSLTGALVALVGILAAAVYGVRRRRTEVRMLNAIGISWSRLGFRFLSESILPIAIGGVVGWLLADRLVRSFGPSASVAPPALLTAATGAIVGCLVALVVFGLVAAVAARVETESASSGRLRSALSGALWEVPVLILAGAALYEIDTRGTAPVQELNGSVHIDRLFLLFPILFIAGFAGLVVRALSRLLIRMRTRSAKWPTAAYLAARRLSSAPRVALLLVTASCLAVGILAYAGTVVSTIRAATLNKTMVSVGANVAATHGANLVLIPSPGRPADITRVISVSGNAEPGNVGINLIAIDPSTFGSTAFWDPSFSSHPLPELLRDLSHSGAEALPAIVVNAPEPVSSVAVAGYPIPLHVVDSIDAFPGEHPGLNVVVSASALRTTLETHGQTIDDVGASYSTWAGGDTTAAVRYFKSLGISPQLIVSADTLLHAPQLRALAWAFGFMEVLGAMAALVALIGLVLYLQARQRGREMTFALSHRMGLSPTSHLLAVLAELSSILLAALAIGTVLAVGAAYLVFHKLDPLPTLPPAALLELPVGLVGGILLGILVSSLIGSWIVQRQTEHANIAEVMRFAD